MAKMTKKARHEAASAAEFERQRLQTIADMTPAPWQPKTGARCGCRPGVWRDNCPTCEGTGWAIDFAAIHARKAGAS